MSLIALGLSHHTAPVELRERLAFDASVPRALNALRAQRERCAAVLLSTCNRVEIYAHEPGAGADLSAALRAFLSAFHGVPQEAFAGALYEHEGRAAAAHLFRVAASLDSLVVGETQILGQVHEAYLLAQTEQTVDKVLSGLFQRAFALAKRVRTQTAVSTGKVSVSSVAVDLAASIFMDFAGKCVLVIGSGDMAELTLKSLVEQGAREVVVVNRSIKRAEAMAAAYGGQAARLDALDEHLPRADMLISSTAAPDYILTPERFETALKKRAQKPMFVIDIAVPRDVDPRVNALDNVYLYDMDALEEVAARNLEARRLEVDKGLRLVEEAADRFWAWLQGLEAEPAIRSMQRELEAIRARELDKTLDALPELTEAQRQEVAYLTQRIVAAILQRPMSQVKREIAHHDPGTVLHLFRRLFGLGEH